MPSCMVLGYKCSQVDAIRLVRSFAFPLGEINHVVEIGVWTEDSLTIDGKGLTKFVLYNRLGGGEGGKDDLIG